MNENSINKMDNFRKSRIADKSINRANKRRQRRELIAGRFKVAVKAVILHMFVYIGAFGGLLLLILMLAAATLGALHNYNSIESILRLFI